MAISQIQGPCFSGEHEFKTPSHGIRRPPFRLIDKFCKFECSILPKRYIVILMMFLGNMLLLAMRRKKLVFDYPNDFPTMRNLNVAFQRGLVSSQILGGMLAFLFPANKIYGLSILGSSILSILIPIIISAPGVLVATIAAMLQGYIEGMTAVSAIGVLRFWTTPTERFRFVTIALSGIKFGILIGILLTKLFDGDKGNLQAFYIFGFLGIVWYLFWYWLCFESPRKHPTISEAELEYIEESLKESETPSSKGESCCGLLCLMPFYAIFLVTVLQHLNEYFLHLCKIHYLFEKFPNIDIGINETVIAVIVLPLSGVLIDYLQKKRIISTTNVRKLTYCVGLTMEGLIYFLVLYINSETIVWLAECACTVFNSFIMPIATVNLLEIAPRFAALLMGVFQAIGMLILFLLESAFVNRFFFEWPNMYAYVFGTSLVVCGFFALFGSSEVQSCARTKPKNGRVLACPATESQL